MRLLGQQQQRCGDPVDTYKNVDALFNQGRADQSCGGKGLDGYRYQCVEYIRRFYRVAKNIDTSKWAGKGNADAWYLKPGEHFDLLKFQNNGPTPPQVDDILAFSGTPMGHVAIVREVNDSGGPTFTITIIEQNVAKTANKLLTVERKNDGTFRMLPRISSIPGGKSLVPEAWLRARPVSSSPNQPPAAGFVMTSGGQTATKGQTLNLTVPVGGSAAVTFDGASPRSLDADGSVAAWKWTVNGLNASTESTFSQTFVIGTHTVGLIVADNQGALSQEALGTVVISTSPQPCPPTFTDNFNRTDGPVGNGWQNSTSTTNRNLLIRDGALSTAGIETSAAVFRPIVLSKPVTISATLTQGNGFGGLLRRYAATLLFGSNGSFSNGYGVGFYRSDQDYSDSRVVLISNGVQLASAQSTFQFGTSVKAMFTLHTDGSVRGVVSGPEGTFNFEFGPRSIPLPGSNVAIELGPPDARSAVITNPTVDNIAISYLCAVTIPSEYLLTDIGPGVANAINNAGTVVGVNGLGTPSHGFVWSNNLGLRDLGTMPGLPYATAVGVNDSGQIVGWSALSGLGESSRGFLSDNGGPLVALIPPDGTQMSFPFAPYVYPGGINNQGKIVGWINGTNAGVSVFDAFVYSANVMTRINIPAVGLGVPGAINNLDQIAGGTRSGAGNAHAFVYDNGRLNDIHSLGSVSYAIGINNNGEVVGSAFISGVEHGFLYSGTLMQDLGVLPGGGSDSTARGINDASHIVGTSAGKAFVWSSIAGMVDLNTRIQTPGWTLLSANAINNSGQIIGSGRRSDGQFRAFLLTPK